VRRSTLCDPTGFAAPLIRSRSQLARTLAGFLFIRMLADLRMPVVIPAAAAGAGFDGHDRTLRADPAATREPPLPRCQVYVYTAECQFDLTPAHATVKLESTGAEQRVTAIAIPPEVANVLYGVHDRFEARFDPKTFCSLGLTKHTQEGPQKRDTQVTFDYPNVRAFSRKKTLKTGENKQSGKRHPALRD